MNIVTRLALVILGFSLCLQAKAQLYSASGVQGVTNGSTTNVGVGTSSPQVTFEVFGNGQVVRNPVSIGYTTLRLYNDQNDMFRALEIDYSGSQYSGVLVNGGPVGESGSITTTGSFPLTFGTNNTARIIIKSDGKIGINNTNPGALLDITTSSAPQLFLSTSRTFSTSRNWGVGTNWNAEGDFSILQSTTNADTPSLTRFLIDVNGNVGIGTNVPSAPLDVSGPSTWGGTVRANSDMYSSFGLYQNNSLRWAIYNHPGANNALFFANSSGQDQISITQDGKMGIGTIDPGSFKLAVNGKIWTQEVNVAMTNPGPDYVFEEDYDLLSLPELEAYVKQNKHLPEVPSAKQMDEEGLNLKEMNLILLKKVEELTLHLIEKEKVLQKQQSKLDALDDKFHELQSQVESLMK